MSFHRRFSPPSPEDGEPHDARRPLAVPNDRGDVAVSGLAWHPTKPILAVAYRDGALKIWSPRERRCAEDAVAHAGGGGIVALRWSRADSANPRANASGASSANETVANAETADCFRVLATGDASGLVAFWTVDRRARPEKIADLRLGMAFPETRAYPQPRRVTYLLAAPRPRDGRGIAAEFRFLVGYARESREGENDD